MCRGVERESGVQDLFLGLAVGITSLVEEADATQMEHSEKSKVAFPVLCAGDIDWGAAVGKCR